MIKPSLYFLLCAFWILPAGSMKAQSEYRQIDRYLQLIREEFSAEAAYRTTEYVSERWRLPGNAGFDSSIYYVKHILERAGFQASGQALPDRMTYRIERHPMRLPAWEPVGAQVQIVGEDQPLLDFATNRNMIAINSFATPEAGLEAELVYLPSCNAEDLSALDLKGKIVMADCHSRTLFKLAVEEFGAAGIFSYRIPSYNQPERYVHSIPFTSIPFNSAYKTWGINLSFAAREHLLETLKAGPVRLKVTIDTRITPAEELTLIAEIPGAMRPEERFVYSAHVQEPGANDNASGVGALAEMARVAAGLYQNQQLRPARTLTFIWGDEIRATRRYIQEEDARAKGIIWGMSLDMVGEDTEKTGGTFLIEKMPDPSAIWTRGEDQHTEWGASPVSEEQFNPHYFNDIVEAVCRRQAKGRNWQVNTNPFEGGSDHQPFLEANIPGLLFWHFTDAFYHTDADRIDKVSPTTLKHVGSSALATGFLLTSGEEAAAEAVLQLTKTAALKRLAAELALSVAAIRVGSPAAEEARILQSWTDWYTGALSRVADIIFGPPSPVLRKKIEQAGKQVLIKSQKGIKQLKE